MTRRLRDSKSLPTLTVGLLLSLFSLTGCGLSSSDEVPEQIATTQLGGGNVAVISDVPSEVGVISDEDFEHALEYAASQDDLDQPPPPESKKYAKLRDSTMEELLQAAWIEGEAEDLGIEVTQREIDSELEQIKRDSFPTEAAYRRFLRESHLSQEAAENRVRQQLLSTRIQEEFGEDQERFADFVSRFEEEWRSRTLCAPDYRMEKCSNGPPS
ncbi:MAG TPA: SurA N-terminal domain-containing protein [Solirubrobacterales bacterium]|nr:SurA N-terminal domain-containing protein [Solirubrobacterales bacterium]